MTDTNTAEREAFETWYRTTNWPGDLGQHEGRYMSNIADASWQAWQARASLAASAGSEPVTWRAQFDAWWARNRVSTHQVKNIGGFAAKVWHAAIQTVVGATDSTAGFYPADEGSTPSRQATNPSPPEGMAVEPVAIRPDIQAVLAMLDVPVIARMSSHEGKLLKPGQEPPAFESAVPLVREWDHRRACESIIAALSRNN